VFKEASEAAEAKRALEEAKEEEIVQEAAERGRDKVEGAAAEETKKVTQSIGKKRTEARHAGPKSVEKVPEKGSEGARKQKKVK
jgi:hypothetical protein